MREGKGIIWKMKRRLSKGLLEAEGKKQRKEAKMQPLAKDLDILIWRLSLIHI